MFLNTKMYPNSEKCKLKGFLCQIDIYSAVICHSC